jgi:hypothetical protein
MSKRIHDEIWDEDPEMAHRRPSIVSQPPSAPSFLPSTQADENWRHFDSMNPPDQPPRYRHVRSASFSSGPMYGTQQSPSMGAQAAMMLPSPSSMNLPMPPSFPRLQSPSQVMPSSAHSSHVQDLQHQITVKSLTLQTLQREYDALLQKLERMRLRTQTLEKKFEVSDAEINSLADEKERLTNQVQTLEAQVEELQQARDEARKTGAETAAQYMKIVEMAGRLQGQGTDSKKSWEQERELMLARIRELEGIRSSAYSREGGAAGKSSPVVGLQYQQTPLIGSSTGGVSIVASPWEGHPQGADEGISLRAELQALKERNKILEDAVKGIVASATSALGLT